MKFVNQKQKKLLELICNSGKLVFATGVSGVSANLVGEFSIQKNHKDEDQLNVGDGTNHVHIDWSVVKSFELGRFHGEGMIQFFNVEGEKLFRFYRLAGLFSQELYEFEKDLF